MIDIALYVLLGIAISCGVQAAVGKHKAKRERFERIVKANMVDVFWEQMKTVNSYQIRDFKERTELIIDSKLAEKEGKHETD